MGVGKAAGRDETLFIGLLEIGLKHCGQRGSSPFSERKRRLSWFKNRQGCGRQV